MARNRPTLPDQASDVARQQVEFGPARPLVPGPSADTHSAAFVAPHDGSLGVRPNGTPSLKTSTWTPV